MGNMPSSNFNGPRFKSQQGSQLLLLRAFVIFSEAPGKCHHKKSNWVSLRPRIFSTFGTTRVVGRRQNAPAAFTPREIPGTHFQRLSRPQGTWFCRKELWKKSQVTPPGIDPGTVRLVAQRLNHFATPGPQIQDSVSGNDVYDEQGKMHIAGLQNQCRYFIRT
jgi:hypothetical protein